MAFYVSIWNFENKLEFELEIKIIPYVLQVNLI